MKKLLIALVAIFALMAAQAYAVDIPPVLIITASPGTTVNQTVVITAIASDSQDNAGIDEIQIFEDQVHFLQVCFCNC